MAADEEFSTDDISYNAKAPWISENSETFKSPSVEPSGSKKTKKKIKAAILNCAKCKDLIKEKHLFALGDHYWHKSCSKCDNCNVQLDDTCFIVDETIFCRNCYNRSAHVTKCMGCNEPMQTHEVAMFALNKPYHLPCFKCYYCGNLISKGDKYLITDGQIICKQDFESGKLNSKIPSALTVKQLQKSVSHQEVNGIRRKTRITPDQRLFLENFYSKFPNPTMKQRESIANELKLSVKVVQTWFCNYRTKLRLQRTNGVRLSGDTHQSSDDKESNGSSVKVVSLRQHQCFTPDQDCSTNCQISQSTEDHASPQDLSDLSGMYSCPDLSSSSSHPPPSTHQKFTGMFYHHQRSEEHSNESSSEHGGFTYTELTNSCAKSVERSILVGFSDMNNESDDGGSPRNLLESRYDIVDCSKFAKSKKLLKQQDHKPSNVCYTWS